MEDAYKEACARGYARNHRAKILVLGPKDSGKTSFINRLLGKEFMENFSSTNGIHVRLVKSQFNKRIVHTESWAETTISQDDILENFYGSVWSMVNAPSKGNIPNEAVTERSPIKTMDQHTRDKLLSHRKVSPQEDNIPYHIQLWDTSGHDEYIATNNFFLDAESTTLIVMDITKTILSSLTGNKLKGIPNTPEEFLHYWLSSIQNKALEKNIDPSVALVLTHKDQVGTEYIDSYIRTVLDVIADKPYSTYITKENIFVIDNKTGSGPDFGHIRSQVFQMVSLQSHWGKKKPVRWLKLETDMLQIAKEAEAKYIELTTVNKLASAYGMAAGEVRSFLEFHNAFGNFAYYSDPTLRDIVILNPQWLAAMFASLIAARRCLHKNYSELAGELKHGIVSEENLKKLWDETDIKFTADLMVKFNLMLHLDETVGQRYLVPCMLPFKQRDIYEAAPFKSMILAYNATHDSNIREAFPIETFHRFLTKCSKTSGWKICAEDHLSYTDASFLILSGLRLALTLLDFTKLRVSLWAPGNLSYSIIRSAILKVRKILEIYLKDLDVAPGNTFLMMCPYWQPGHDVCLAKIQELLDESVRKFYPLVEKCPLHKMALSDGHFSWIKHERNSKYTA